MLIEHQSVSINRISSKKCLENVEPCTLFARDIFIVNNIDAYVIRDYWCYWNGVRRMQRDRAWDIYASRYIIYVVVLHDVIRRTKRTIFEQNGIGRLMEVFVHS